MLKYEVLKSLLEANRSVRRFDESREIGKDMLEQLVGLARLCASGRNLQPLRYRIVTEHQDCVKLFPALAWAGYYKDWPGPSVGERPTAYIVQCLDTTLCHNVLCDDGLQLEAITLGATAMGVSGCIIKSFNKQQIIDVLKLGSQYVPLYIVALGYAAEKVKIVDVADDGDIRYFRDKDSTQCVPKRPLHELLI